VISRLILFDIDGTLIDTAGAGRIAMERACSIVFGIDGVSAKAAGVRFAGMTDPVILEAVSGAIGVPSERYAAARERLQWTFLRELRAELARHEPRRRVLPGVGALLDELAARGHVRMGLLTGNLEEGARLKLQALGLDGYFPGGGFSSDHPDRREIARIARDRLSTLAGLEFAAGDVVVVGDTEHDVDCARANGFRAVAVCHGPVPRRELERARPDAILDDFLDRPRALDAFGVA
jgi:phosphoglycolate phosphatase-like HAD superfamily hydrolase